jgi:hypothetical protein
MAPFVWRRSCALERADRSRRVHSQRGDGAQVPPPVLHSLLVTPGPTQPTVERGVALQMSQSFVQSQTVRHFVLPVHA